MTLTAIDVSVVAALFLVAALIVGGICVWLLFRRDKQIERRQQWQYWEHEFHCDWQDYQAEKAAGDDGEGAYA